MVTGSRTIARRGRAIGLLLCSSALVLSACGGKAHTDGGRVSNDAGPISSDAGPISSDAGPIDSPLPVTIWNQALATSECDKAQRCGEAYSSAVACTAKRSNDARALQYWSGLDIQAYMDSLYTVDPAARAACLAAIEASSCYAATSDLPACTHVLVPRAPLHAGEACRAPNNYFPASPCEAGYVCGFAVDCLACIPEPPPPKYPGLGESCSSSACGAGLTCDLASQTCIQLALLGLHDKCGGSIACGRDLYCSNGTTCELQASAGLGMPCARNTMDPALTCANDAWCSFDAPDAAFGTCGLTMPALPAPCTSIGCPGKSVKDTHGDSSQSPTYCMCLPLPHVGEPCLRMGDDQCDHGVCTLMGEKDWRCAPLPAGSECYAQSDCPFMNCEGGHCAACNAD